jgi:excisionase family DNA binding protein
MKRVLDVDLYDAHEIAEMLGVSKTTVHNYVNCGKLESQKIGGRLYCSEQNIKAFINGDVKRELKQA